MAKWLKKTRLFPGGTPLQHPSTAPLRAADILKYKRERESERERERERESARARIERYIDGYR
jgi:hypothetical protein